MKFNRFHRYGSIDRLIGLTGPCLPGDPSCKEKLCALAGFAGMSLKIAGSFREIDAQLHQILIVWYFSTKNRPSLRLEYKKLSSTDLVDLWLEVWFAKNNRQIIVDEKLREFEPLIDEYVCYNPTNVDEAIALIILFDQIPRNVYRGTDKAYAYDHISLALARSLVPFSADLPLCMRLTLTICLFHSEDLPDHRAAAALAAALRRDPFCDGAVAARVLEMAENHRGRVEAFGRIPERNAPLRRAPTPAEVAFMAAVQPVCR